MCFQQMERLLRLRLPSALEPRYSLAREWVRANTVSGAGICRTSRHRVPYPEVSGY